MGKTSGSTGSGNGEQGQSPLTEEHVRVIVEQSMQPHVTIIKETIDRLGDIRSSDTLLERLFEGFGELRSIKDLLPTPRELEPDQKKTLARIRAETARLSDSATPTDSPEKRSI